MMISGNSAYSYDLSDIISFIVGLIVSSGFSYMVISLLFPSPNSDSEYFESEWKSKVAGYDLPATLFFH